MTERDPLDHLTAAGRSEDPDPQFAARLIDKLLAELDIEPLTTGAAMTAVPLQEDTPMKTMSPRWRWTLLGAAATVVVLVIGLVVLVTDDEDDGEILDTPPPTAATTPTTEPPTTEPATTEPATTEPTTTTAAPTGSTLDPAEAAWEQIPIMLFPGVTGEFRTNTFDVPFSFDTGDMPYTKDWERENWIAISNEELQGWIDVFAGLDSIDATIEEFRRMHDASESAQMDEPVPARLRGAEGVVFRSVGLPAGVAQSEQDLFEFTAPIPERRWTNSTAYGIAMPGTSSPGSDGVSIWVVDVDGQTVVVAQSALDMGLSPEAQALSRPAIQALVESIVWKELA